MTEVKNQNLVGSSNLGKIREEIAMWDDLEQEALLFIDSVDMIDNPKQPIDDLIEFCDLTYKMAQNYIKSESLLKSKNIPQQDINKIKKVAQKLASNAYETKLLLIRVKGFADMLGKKYSHLKNNKNIDPSMFR
jgi:predicted transcriptional regulator